MDLTRLYNLTTPELRHEAERLGVSDTYAMSRGQLIHAIRNHVGGPPPEGLLGRVLGLAKWALQPRKDEAAQHPKAEPARVRDVVVPVPAPVSAPAPESVPASASAPLPPPEPLPAPASAPQPAAASASVSGPESAPVMASELVPASESSPATELVSPSEPELEPELESVAASESGPPSRAPAGVFSNSAGMFEEPFPTRTMARILAEQGHFKRSLAIYATLLRDEPGDGELSAEADEVRERARARRSHVH